MSLLSNICGEKKSSLAHNKIIFIIKDKYYSITEAHVEIEAENKSEIRRRQTGKKTRTGNKKKDKDFHASHVLPGGKALETEGLREASSVGQGQGSGSGYKG